MIISILLIKRRRIIVLLVGERSRKLRKSYFNSDREALAGDVVSVLGVEVAPQPEDPAVLQRSDLGGCSKSPETCIFRGQ